MTQTTISQSVSAEQAPAPGEGFGTLSEQGRATIETVLRASHGSPAAAEAHRLGAVADAYAAGWRAGRREALGADYLKAMDLAALFAVEYAWAAYAYSTGASHYRPGYANAWDKVLEANGLPL